MTPGGLLSLPAGLRLERFRLSFAAGLVLLAVAYFLGAKLGFVLTPQRLPISMLWPPNALLLAALLLTEPRRWWMLVAAVLPAHFAAELHTGVPLAMVFGWFVSNCSEALLGAVAIRLLRPRPPRFDSFADACVILLCGALFAPILSSFLDAALVKAIGWNDTTFWQLVRIRATANTLAALIVVPLVMTLVQNAREALATAPRRLLVEAALLFAGLATVAFILFSNLEPDARRSPALFYAPLPFMLWAAARLGPLGMSFANLLLTAVAIWGAMNGLGPFAGGSPEDNARAVQLFLIAASVPLLLLAVLLEERRRAERDAREQRQQLAHLARVATLGGLSGALAHELNQPLTAILSNAQAAQYMLGSDTIDMRELEEILKDIVAADRRASEVIRRLRALFMNEVIQAQDLDANELVREVLGLARGDLAARDIEVVTNLMQPLPAMRADRVQFQQVLLNLVLNASEAMAAAPAGARRLTVSTRAAGEGGVQISFYDQGPGFKPNDAERLFEPFYTTKPKGLGLGLPISRSIIAAHGGKLWGESRAGAGAAFHVLLPPSGPLAWLPH
jgi:signal transduction histidine kinase